MGGDEFCRRARSPRRQRRRSRPRGRARERGEAFAIGCSYGSRPPARRRRSSRRCIWRTSVCTRTSGSTRSGATHRPATCSCACWPSGARRSPRTSQRRSSRGGRRPPARPRRRRGQPHAARRRAARHRQDGDPGRDPQEARPAGWRRVGVHQAPHHHRRTHPRRGPALARIAPLVRSSHERHDGTGYPDGLRGDDIPLGARIVAVVDAFDAMTSRAPTASRSAVSRRSPSSAAAPEASSIRTSWKRSSPCASTPTPVRGLPPSSTSRKWATHPASPLRSVRRELRARQGVAPRADPAGLSVTAVRRVDAGAPGRVAGSRFA